MSAYFSGESILVVGEGPVVDAIERAIVLEGGVVVAGDEVALAELAGLVFVAGSGEHGLAAAAEVLVSAERSVVSAAAALAASGRGSIVLVTPGAGAEATLGLAGYAASAVGLTAAARGWAVEYGGDGTRVNVVRPGVLSTDAALASRAPGIDIGYVPLDRDGSSRVGLPEDVAESVVFLLSDDARYITGAELHVDGGMSQSRNSSAFALWDARLSD